MERYITPGVSNWSKVHNLKVRSFRCGYCGDKVSSDRGYSLGRQNDGSGAQLGGIYICPSCYGPTFFTSQDAQLPFPSLGNSVKDVPGDLYSLYREARRCTGQSCFTAAVLLCRKMLMNIAVDKGADPDLKFIDYVDYLSGKGYTPPDGKHWVDHIRLKGNEATHEIALMSEGDAHDLLMFTEMLLRFIYEFPNMVPTKDSDGNDQV